MITKLKIFDKLRSFRKTNSKNISPCLTLFKNNEYGKFNSMFGSLVPKDRRFWGNMFSGSPAKGLSSGNDSVKQRTTYNELKKRYAQLQDDASKTSLKKDMQLVAKNILTNEIVTPPPTPSIEKFTNNISALTAVEKRDLDCTFTVNGYEQSIPPGFDIYLTKQFFLSAKKSGLPIKLDNTIRKLQEKEYFFLGNPEFLGGGKYNKVHKVNTFQVLDGIAQEPKQLVWKPIGSSNKNNVQGLLSSSNLGGINRKTTHAAYQERSVLTKLLDTFLFPNNSVCADTDSAHISPGMIDGDSPNSSVSGVMMSIAPGQPAVLKCVKFNLKNGSKDSSNKKAFSKLRKYIPRITSDDDIKHFFPLKMDWLKENIPPDATFNIKNDVLTIQDIKIVFNDRNAFKTALENSIRLGILDFITGQIDRHYENYYVDTQTGKVVAIDNDLSFTTQTAGRGQNAGMGIIPNKGSLLADLPKIVTPKIKEEIIEFLTSGKHVEFMSEVEKIFPHRSTEQIAICNRIQKIQNLFMPLKSNPIKTEDDLTLNPTSLDTETNYLVRDLLVTRKKSKFIDSLGWNLYRKNRIKTVLSEAEIKNRTMSPSNKEPNPPPIPPRPNKTINSPTVPARSTVNPPPIPARPGKKIFDT